MKTKTRVLLSLISLFGVCAIMTVVYLISNWGFKSYCDGDIDKTGITAQTDPEVPPQKDEGGNDTVTGGEEGSEEGGENDNKTKYTLTINYQCNGTEMATAYVKEFEEGQAYSINSPSVTGYTATETVVAGTMHATDTKVTVQYTIKSYKLTIKSLYGSNVDIDERNVEFKSSVEITPKTIVGYKANVENFTFTMPAENKVVTINYNVNIHDVNVCVCTDNVEKFTTIEKVAFNNEYNVSSYISKGVENGYELADYNVKMSPNAVGTMPDSNIEVTVDLTSKKYDLTINYIDEDSNKLTDSTVVSLKRNELYSVIIPTFAHYNTTATNFTKTIENRENASVDIIYKTNEYKATFFNADKKLKELSVKYGETYTIPTLEGIEKDRTAQFTYSFANTWNNNLVKTGDEVTMLGDINYTADFTATTNVYTMTWNYKAVVNGELIDTSKTTNVAYGDTPVSPFVSSFEFKGIKYSFVGWDAEFDAVTGDKEFNAQYATTILKYSVKFTDENGIILFSLKLKYGDEITAPEGFDGKNWKFPEWTINFEGWAGLTAGMTVTGDVSFVMITSQVKNKYSVTWVYTGEDGNEETLEVSYEYGQIPTFKGKHISADNTYEYKFLSWDKTVSEVVGDVTYKAEYSLTYINYTISFTDWNGDLISNNTYHYGDVITFPVAPTRGSDGIYTYTFLNWSDAETVVDGNKTYIAVYGYTEITYTIVWTDYDGTVIDNNGEDVPQRASNGEYTYTFKEWIELNTVIENWTETRTESADGTEVEIVYTANYSQTYIEYTEVYYISLEGKKSEHFRNNHHYGEGVTPAVPSMTATVEYTYIYSAWEKTETEVDENGNVVTTYISTCTTQIRTYTITWSIGEQKTNETYDYGHMPKCPSSTSRENYSANGSIIVTYEFTTWDKEIVNVDGNATYVAQYKCVYTYSYENSETYGNYIFTCKYTVVVEFNYVEGMDIDEQCSKSIDVSISFEFLITENKVDIQENEFDCSYIWNRNDGRKVNKCCQARH